MSKRNAKKPAAPKAAQRSVPDVLAGSPLTPLQNVGVMATSFVGPDGMPADVQDVLGKFPNAVQGSLGKLTGDARADAVKQFSVLTDDILRTLTDQRVGEDELRALKNKVVTEYVRINAFRGDKVQPRAALRALSEIGGQFDRGVAAHVLKSKLAVQAQAMQALDFDALLKAASTGQGTVGELMANSLRGTYPKLGVVVDLQQLPRTLAKITNPDELKKAMSDAAEQLGKSGATKTQIRKAMETFAADHGALPQEIKSASTAGGSVKLLRSLFTNREGRVSKGRIAGAMALGTMALWAVNEVAKAAEGSDREVSGVLSGAGEAVLRGGKHVIRFLGGMGNKPAPKTAPAPTSIEDDMARALMNPMNANAGNLLDLMKMTAQAEAAQGQAGGTLAGLAARDELAPFQHGFSSAEIPLASMLAQGAYEQEASELQNPRLLDMRQALVQQ